MEGDPVRYHEDDLQEISLRAEQLAHQRQSKAATGSAQRFI